MHMQPTSNTPQNADAVAAYLQSKKTLYPGEQKGQLVINNKVLVCRELTNLEKLGKKFGLGPASARQVLQFVRDNNISVSDPARLEYKLEKHTIRGFIKSFFYPKPPKQESIIPTKQMPKEEIAPFKPDPTTMSDTGSIKGYTLTMIITPEGNIECSAKKDKVDIVVPAQITKAVNDFAKLGPNKYNESFFHQEIFSKFAEQMRHYSKTDFKIGDEINFSQTQRQQKYYPKIFDAKCTVTNVHYDEDKKDVVYTFQRIIGDSTREVWSETSQQLQTPAQPIKGAE
ncbi:MAG: hypothetical protein LLF94_09870 [Chlamydiales bacterium]|nr:hypothetical protein [Chlamydiales bacterium]